MDQFTRELHILTQNPASARRRDSKRKQTVTVGKTINNIDPTRRFSSRFVIGGGLDGTLSISQISRSWNESTIDHKRGQERERANNIFITRVSGVPTSKIRPFGGGMLSAAFCQTTVNTVRSSLGSGITHDPHRP